MRRRDSDSSICRLAWIAACGLLLGDAGWAQGVAAPQSHIEFRQYEAFPDLDRDNPPPPDLVGKSVTRGTVATSNSADLRRPQARLIVLQRPTVNERRWLRARFTLPAAPRGVHALYVSAANRGVTAFINGVQVGSTSVSDAETFGWNYPIFFTVPDALLHEGANILDLKMTLTRQGHGTIRGVQLAPYEQLKPLYDRVLFWRVTGPQITTLIAVLFGAIALLMFARRPSDTQYGWFAAAALLGALRNAHFYVSLPIAEEWYEFFALVPLMWMSVTLVIFAFRLCGDRFPRLERALVLGAACWTTACLLSDHVLVIDVGYFALTALSLATIGYLGVQCWRAPRLERVLFLIAALVTQVFGALDLALLLGLRSDEYRVYLMPYSVLLFSAVIGAVLVDAFAKARGQQERLNRELDERLAARERELNETHQQVLKLERERSVSGERQRILRDIHDGLGSQLVSSMQLVERGELTTAAVADVLRECIDDLRLAIDSLKPVGDDLLAVLGNFRYRMEPRLAHAGVRLEWQVDADARSPALTSEQVLHTLRIVQEAVANALKHANPTRVRVHYAETGGAGWQLEVADDGPGFAAQSEGRGDGLANMRARAGQAGLRVEVMGSTSGTCVRIAATGAEFID
jgi:signal transduction histidine kinase